MEKIIELKGFIFTTNGREPFHLKIFPPIKSEDESDFYCRIHCPFLFRDDKNIFGVNKTQSLELAAGFVKSLLHQTKVVDELGIEIKIDSLLTV